MFRKVTVSITFIAFVFTVVVGDKISGVYIIQSSELSGNLSRMIFCARLYLDSKYGGFQDLSSVNCNGVLNEDTETNPNMVGLKTRNTFSFSPPMVLDSKTTYISDIPRGTITGLTIDMFIEPKYPWKNIMVYLEDDSKQYVAIRVKIKNEDQTVNMDSRDDGTFLDNEIITPHMGFLFSADETFKLTILATDLNFKVKYNDVTFHTFDHHIDKSLATRVRITPDSTTVMLLREVNYSVAE